MLKKKKKTAHREELKLKLPTSEVIREIFVQGGFQCLVTCESG